MSKSVQDHLAIVTEGAANDLIEAAKEVSDDKFDWSPLGKGRSVLNMMAECAVLNGYTTTILQEGTWEMDAFNDYEGDLNAIATDRESVENALNASIAPLTAAIRALSGDQLDVEIATPFGPMSWEKIATYPYWNMSYHQGQTTYIGILAH